MRFERRQLDVRQSGYTLIEVLVAFMILALALTVLMRIFSGGLRNVSVSSDYAVATLIAESRLAAAGIDAPLTPGETSGTEGERFEWTISVQDYQPWPGYRSTARGVDAYRVTVTVEWPHGDNTRRVGLSTVRLLTEGGIGS
jgi:general secretion pathway protein I